MSSSGNKGSNVDKQDKTNGTETTKDSITDGIAVGNAIFAGLQNMRGTFNGMSYDIKLLTDYADVNYQELRDFVRNFKELKDTLELVAIELHAANLLKLAEINTNKKGGEGIVAEDPLNAVAIMHLTDPLIAQTTERHSLAARKKAERDARQSTEREKHG